ncbi:MAG TPA: hypothetical protein VNW53_14125 [Phenylobacterium sp.]|jgi:hypothetical protein|uniref:hypothetical protein n=1 Tax=Phenylobacterium sp. TaxID=1871053 RepID=UPI002CA25A7F|nr:hypothetical protein [Phenylobacterium sp.]HXA40132.1 hypothetical protein [Phenylobacterium sp.]
MATTSDVKITPGSGNNVATYDITEDAETRKLQRVVLSDNTGADINFSVASPVTQSGTWSLANISGTVSLPTGAATSALQTTGNTALTTINTTLGTPMQATGGTVGLVAGAAAIGTVAPTGRTYKTIAASQTAQTLGTGATGDVLDGLLIVPASVNAGNVIILDNATSITVFAGGSPSVSNLVPFWIALNSAASVSGAWKVTTGANVSVIAVGKFTP